MSILLQAKSLLETDDYSGLTDLEATILASQKRHNVIRSTILTYVGLQAAGVSLELVAKLAAIVDAAAGSNPAIAKSKTWLETPDAGLDWGDAQIRGMVDLFVTTEGNGFSEADGNTIKAVAEFTESDSDKVGVVLEEKHFRLARTL